MPFVNCVVRRYLFFRAVGKGQDDFENKAVFAPFSHALDRTFVLSEPACAYMRSENIFARLQKVRYVEGIVVYSVAELVMYRIECLCKISFAVVGFRRHEPVVTQPDSVYKRLKIAESRDFQNRLDAFLHIEAGAHKTSLCPGEGEHSALFEWRFFHSMSNSFYKKDTAFSQFFDKKRRRFFISVYFVWGIRVKPRV